MRLLLDTHVFLWLVWGHPQLSATARGLLSDPRNDLCLSAASIWEMAIKVGSKKLVLGAPLDEFVSLWMGTYQVESLPVESKHALAVANLPHHHGDPFDRMLIAQSRIEKTPLLSYDAIFDLYEIERLW